MFAVLMIDIDHFKRVNDTHGHPVGDAVIKELADVATRTLRPVISSRATAERNSSSACPIPNRTRRSSPPSGCARRSKPPRLSAIRVRFAYGQHRRGCLLARRRRFQDAIACADKALYSAKKNGRNRVELSMASMHADSSEPSASGASLEKAARAANHILVVDDEPEIRALLATWLEESGYTW